MVELFANSEYPDQTPHSAASDLGLHCLPNTLLGVSRLQCQEGQLSVSGERMCTILVNRLACPVNVWLGKLTALDMTPLG